MARANGNGNGAGAHAEGGRRRRRGKADLKVHEGGGGRPPADDDQPGAKVEGEVPDVYSSVSFKEFLRRYEMAQSDLHQAQSDLREIYKAETDRGLNRAAAKIALSWHSKILNDKMGAAEAYENLDAIKTLLDWMGHDVEARDLVHRMGEEAGVTPPV